MKKTLMVMSSNREMERETKESVMRLRQLGAAFMIESGSADIAFARCRALSMACEQLDGACSDRDVVLMVDDDMDFDAETAQKVVENARGSGLPTAAAYATINGTLAAERLATGLWLCGLGFLAIPVPLLRSLEKESDSFEHTGKVYTAFTWSKPQGGRWWHEDWTLTLRLGGVHLMPLAVGHVKKIPILPDDETMEKIAKMEGPK